MSASPVNPLLDEINGLSPQAKAALLQAHSAGGPQAPGSAITPNPMPGKIPTPSVTGGERLNLQGFGPGTEMNPLKPESGREYTDSTMPSSMPPPTLPMGTPSLAAIGNPNPPAPRGTISGDTSELARLQRTGSGISQINGRIEQAMPNHPLLGKILGFGAEIPARIGDMALSRVSPITAAMLTGTELHHEHLLNEASRQLSQDESDAAKEAEASQVAAETGKVEAETAGIPGREDETKRLTDSEIAERNARTSELLHPVAKNEFDVWQQQNPGKPIEDWLKAKQEPVQKKQESPTVELQRQLIEAQNSGDSAAAKKLQNQIKDLNPAAEQKFDFQVGQAGKNAGKVSDANTEKEYAYQRNKWDKDLGLYNTQNEKLQEAESFIGQGAMGDALASIKTLSGLAAGQGSGIRITQAELNSIVHARGYGGDFAAAMQKFGDGKNLTPAQEGQLKNVLADVQKLASRKERVINKVIDDLANATDVKTIREVDSQARHALMGGQ